MAKPDPPQPPAHAPVPPQNLEAEESVLGAMMLSPGAIAAVAEILQAGDFYKHTHGTIYRVALQLDAAGEPVDAITLVDALSLSGDLDAVGGKGRIHELAALVPATSNAAHYARIVKEMATLRGLIGAGSEIQRLGYDRPEATPILVERAEGLIFDLAAGRTTGGFRGVADDVKEAYAALEELHRTGGGLTGVSCGFKAIDDLTAGFQPGSLIVLAARPSMGKSALGLGFAANVAIHQGIPAAVFSLEMSRAEIINRMFASEGFVDSHLLRSGHLDADDWSKVSTAAGKIAAAPLFIDDAPAQTMTEIRSKARRLKLRHPDLALILVDYLQLMGGAPDATAYQRVTENSLALKALARELGVPVVAMSQLSRAVEQRHDKRPMLSDLRESGAIEQDADVVMFIYRDEYYNPEDTDQQGVAEINIAKQRNGPTNTVKLAFVKRHVRFSNLPPSGMAG